MNCVPDRRQSIIWTNADELSFGPQGTKYSDILIAIQKVLLKNAFENLVCKIAAILARPQWVNMGQQLGRNYLFSDR